MCNITDSVNGTAEYYQSLYCAQTTRSPSSRCTGYYCVFPNPKSQVCQTNFPNATWHPSPGRRLVQAEAQLSAGAEDEAAGNLARAGLVGEEAQLAHAPALLQRQAVQHTPARRRRSCLRRDTVHDNPQNSLGTPTAPQNARCPQHHIFNLLWSHYKHTGILQARNQ